MEHFIQEIPAPSLNPPVMQEFEAVVIGGEVVHGQL